MKKTNKTSLDGWACQAPVIGALGRTRTANPLIRSQGHYLISGSPSLYKPRGQIVFNLSEIRCELALKWMVSIKVIDAVQAHI